MSTQHTGDGPPGDDNYYDPEGENNGPSGSGFNPNGATGGDDGSGGGCAAKTWEAEDGLSGSSGFFSCKEARGACVADRNPRD